MAGTPQKPPIDDDDDHVAVGGGTFTQEAVDSIVRDRLARQKATLETKYATAIAEGTELKKQNEILIAKAAKYDALFKKSLEDRLKTLPESVVKLLEKLAPDEQVAWLDENADKVIPAPVTPGPQTPLPKDKVLEGDALLALKSNTGDYRI